MADPRQCLVTYRHKACDRAGERRLSRVDGPFQIWGPQSHRASWLQRQPCPRAVRMSPRRRGWAASRSTSRRLLESRTRLRSRHCTNRAPSTDHHHPRSYCVAAQQETCRQATAPGGEKSSVREAIPGQANGVEAAPTKVSDLRLDSSPLGVIGSDRRRPPSRRSQQCVLPLSALSRFSGRLPRWPCSPAASRPGRSLTAGDPLTS